MKHRYFFTDTDHRHEAEVKMYDNYPADAIQKAEEYINREFEPWAKLESKERVLIARNHDRFEILTESSSDYRLYEFTYNPLSGDVNYVRMEGDWKR